MWERDGVLIDSLEGALQLQLRVDPVQLVDQGHYTCRAELPNQPHLAAVSAGTLTVLGKVCYFEVPSQVISSAYAAGDINVPRVQVAIEGTRTQLNCSYPGGIATWTKNGVEVRNVFSAVTAADEGEYVCDIYRFDERISTQVPVMFYVVGESLHVS